MLVTLILVVAAATPAFATTDTTKPAQPESGTSVGHNVKRRHDLVPIARERVQVEVPADVAGEEIVEWGWETLYVSEEMAQQLQLAKQATQTLSVDEARSHVESLSGCSTLTYLGDPYYQAPPADWVQSNAYVDRGSGCTDAAFWYHWLLHENIWGNLVKVDTDSDSAAPGQKVWTHVSRTCNSSDTTTWQSRMQVDGGQVDRSPEHDYPCET